LHVPSGFGPRRGGRVTSQLVQGGGEGGLPVGHDALVAQRYSRRGVADALHQLLGGRAGDGREGPGRVAQVVDAQPVQADLADGGEPHQPAEAAAGQVLAADAGEHQPVRAGLGVAVKVLGSAGDGDGGQGHHPPAGVGLGRPGDELAGDLGGLFDHVQPAAGQVDVAAAQPDQFGKAAGHQEVMA
jgi:hypothetical protein